MINSNWQNQLKTTPNRIYTSIELFADAGGLAIGIY